MWWRGRVTRLLRVSLNSRTSGNNDACNYRQISCCVYLLIELCLDCWEMSVFPARALWGDGDGPSGWQRLSCKTCWLKTTQMLLNEFHWGKGKFLVLSLTFATWCKNITNNLWISNTLPKVHIQLIFELLLWLLFTPWSTLWYFCYKLYYWCYHSTHLRLDGSLSKVGCCG